jgi:hypothetical protein
VYFRIDVSFNLAAQHDDVNGESVKMYKFWPLKELVEEAISCAGVPHSFICVLPDWREGQSRGLDSLRKSQWTRWAVSLAKLNHQYCSGFQQWCTDKNMFTVYDGATLLLWLCNRFTAERLHPTADRVSTHVRFWSKEMRGCKQT